MRVDERNRGIDIRHTHDPKHRTEDLLLVNTHLRTNAIEERAAEIVPALRAFKSLAAIDKERRAFAHARVDVVAHARSMLTSDQRTHLGLRIRGRAYDQLRYLWCEALDEAIRGGIANRHGYGDRHTTLARRAVSCSQQRIRRVVHVGVRHHHEMILGPAERLHAFAPQHALAVHMTCNRRRAYEADG